MKTKENYSITVNSDRAHLVLNNVPVETVLFKNFADENTDGKNEVLGFLVAKGLQFNNGIIIISTK